MRRATILIASILVLDCIVGAQEQSVKKERASAIRSSRVSRHNQAQPVNLLSSEEVACPPNVRCLKGVNKVLVQVVINGEGRVIQANAVSGDGKLRKAAEKLAMQKEFEPKLIYGQKLKYSGIIAYIFRQKLRRAAA